MCYFNISNNEWTDASQDERLGRSCLSIACSALSLPHSAHTERDTESRYFVLVAGVHRFISRPKIFL